MTDDKSDNPFFGADSKSGRDIGETAKDNQRQVKLNGQIYHLVTRPFHRSNPKQFETIEFSLKSEGGTRNLFSMIGSIPGNDRPGIQLHLSSQNFLFEDDNFNKSNLKSLKGAVTEVLPSLVSDMADGIISSGKSFDGSIPLSIYTIDNDQEEKYVRELANFLFGNEYTFDISVKPKSTTNSYKLRKLDMVLVPKKKK